MVKLRLRRRGRKKQPIYDIAAMDSRKSRNGEYLEKIGQFNPMTTPSIILLDNERALYWLRQGAQPTDVVRRLLSIQGVMLQIHLERKGKSAEEIQTALQAHTEGVQKRIERDRVKKEQKKKDAAKAAEAAKVAAADATAEG